MHAVILFFPTVEQSDNIFQCLPVDKAHHVDTEEKTTHDKGKSSLPNIFWRQ